MLTSTTNANLNRIVMINPKGGCGKTTLATNLASYFAVKGPMPTLMDFDPQSSSMTWVERRSVSLPPIHGIAAYKQSLHATRSWQLRVPAETDTLIVDSPAGLTHESLRELTREANSILVPVLPSAIDIHAASRCIADLLLVAKVDRRRQKLAVVANRIRRNTRSYEKLMRFLDSLEIPIIAVLRDSQVFVQAVEEGVGVTEMPRHKVKEDARQIEKIAMWTEGTN
ncbi:MAG: AAA family ATPase [Pseudomonadales bacterium]|nr:AAA family ATPase [Pseudomonadales bacterium]